MSNNNYYVVRTSFPPTNQYKYVINQLEGMTGLERNALIRDIVCKYFSEKLHEEDAYREENNAKPQDSGITAMLATITKQMADMQAQQEKLAKENKKLLEEINSQKAAAPTEPQPTSLPTEQEIDLGEMDTSLVPDEALAFLNGLG